MPIEEGDGKAESMMDYHAERRLVTSVGKLRRHWRWILGGAGASGPGSSVLSAVLFSLWCGQPAQLLAADADF